MTSLIDEAIQIAQEHGLRIIACGEDKAPIHKGWRGKASSDPDEIREMFSDPRAKLVGVPTGKDNDLLVFDIDYREGNTLERNDKLWVFANELEAAHPGQIRVHKTRNGGRHLIMLNPEGAKKIPRNIMPKMEVCGEGFQVIWPTEESGYEVLVDVPLDDLVEPEAKFLKVREKMKGISSAGGLMSAGLAQQVMVSDGEVGTRHDALLRMTYDFVAAAPDTMTPEELCASFEAQFRAVYEDYIEPTRLEELMHWRVDGGELGGSDLGNAMKGAIARHPERSGAKLARLERPTFSVWDEKPGDPAPEIPVEAEQASPGLPKPKAWVPPMEDLAVCDTEEELPPREWVLSHKLERGYLSVLWGPPGVGKTITAITWSAMMASGSAMLYETVPDGPKRVVYWNGEDGLTEVKRRLQGVGQSYPTLKKGIAENLRLLDTSQKPMPLVEYKPIDPQSRAMKPAANSAAIEWLKEKLLAFKADVLVVDPLISMHRLRETYPDEMEVLFDELRTMARKLNIAILAVHHFNPGKMGNTPFTVLGAARHATELQRMSKEVAEKKRIAPEEVYKHVRAINGKSSNAAMTKDRWMTLEQVELRNGDTVPVPHSYLATSNPLARGEISTVLNFMLAQPTRDFREHQNSSEWVGLVVAEALGITYQPSASAEHRSDEENAAKGRIHAILSVMIEHGLLKLVRIWDSDKQREIPYYRLTQDADLIKAWEVEDEVSS